MSKEIKVEGSKYMDDGSRYYVISNDTFRLCFYIKDVPSCCGAAMIYYLKATKWDKKEHTNNLKLISEFLISLQERRGKLIIFDAVRGESGLAIYNKNNFTAYEMCVVGGWDKGKPTFNRNSNNHVVSFEHDAASVDRHESAWLKERGYK